MEPQPSQNPAFDSFYTRAFAIGTTLILGLACYQFIEPILGPLLWAILLAFMLHPIQLRLTRRIGNRPTLSAWIITLGSLILILGPLVALGSSFPKQASDLVQSVQTSVTLETREDFQQLVTHPSLQRASAWLKQNLGISNAQVRGWAVEAARNILKYLANTGGQVFLGALGTVASLLLTIFLMFFFIRDGAKIATAVRELVPLPLTKREALFDHLSSVTKAVVLGTGLVALIQGSLIGVAFFILHLPSPLVFAVVASLLALLPFGGAAIVWIPATLILILQGRWGGAIFILVWGVIVSLLDNLLKPLLISGQARVSTLTIIIGVLGGVSVFGGIGLFFGPVVLALVIALVGFALENKREREDQATLANGIHPKPLELPVTSDETSKK
jgi:predicted PurR-regulated permease PerM